MEPLRVLYEDNHLIAVYKPARVLVQADMTGDKSLMDIVKYYLAEKYKKPGNVFLGLVHRLDRSVSGIVLFAKTSKGAARVSEQFRNHEVEKEYHALVLGKADQRGYLRDFIMKDEIKKKAIISETPRDGFQEVELWYEKVSGDARYSLLKIKIISGRYHQIRAQLSNAGYPIMGDTKYGAPEALPDKSIALCATKLAFTTATTDETKVLEVEIPKEWGSLLR